MTLWKKGLASAMRSKSRDTRLGYYASAALVSTLFVFSSSASGTIIQSWSPPYTGGVAYIGSAQSGAGSGSVTWGVPDGFALSTGVGTFNFTVNASAAATSHWGHQQVLHVYSGLNQSYTCSGACSTGNHVVAFNWNVTWSWSELSSCPHTGVTGSAHVTVSLVAEVVNASTGVTVSTQTHTLSAPLAINSCPTSSTGGSASALPVTLSFTVNLLGGHSYYLISFVYADGDASSCSSLFPCSGANGADHFDASVDFAASGNQGLLNSVTVA